jgi:APA family basic amino acid/polyamine antiporter
MSAANGRKLGFWMCTALVVGNMIGSGVFLLPASLAPYGLNSLVAWGLTATGALILALVFAALGRAYPNACGPYDYTRVAFGELAGFVVAWGYWISIWCGNAAIATGAIGYLGTLFPALGTQPVSAVATVALVWVLTGVNALGARTAGSVQVVTTVLKLVPLLAIAGLGLWLLAMRDPSLTTANAPTTFSLDGITAAAALTLWALVGLESATIPGGKVDSPERTIPRATILGTAVTAAIYVLACSCVLLLVPAAQLADSQAPFADVARSVWGNGAAMAFALFAAISGIGALNGWILLQGELPYQMARKGVFPRLFASESARGVPIASLCVSSVLVSVMILANSSKSLVQVFSYIVLVSTSATLVFYLLCSLAVLKLMRTGELRPASGKLRWLAAAAVVGSLYSLWAIYGAGLSTDVKQCGGELICWAPWISNPAVLNVALLALGVPVFYLMRRGKAAAATPAAQEG